MLAKFPSAIFVPNQSAHDFCVLIGQQAKTWLTFIQISRLCRLCQKLAKLPWPLTARIVVSGKTQLAKLNQSEGVDMIYVLEVTPAGEANGWFAFDQNDLIRKISVIRTEPEQLVYQAASPRKLLALAGRTPETATAADAGIVALANEYGWETTLYRADYMLEPGSYQAEEVPELSAAITALAHGLKTCRVYMSEEVAIEALDNDPIFEGRQGYKAYDALHSQLVALDVLPSNL